MPEEQEGLSPQQVLTLRTEHRQRRRDPELMHNLEMHARLLKTWQRDRPAMWARLTALNLTEVMAFLAQQRMWEERDRLVDGGMW